MKNDEHMNKYANKVLHLEVLDMLM